MMLESMGNDIRVAYDGEEAVTRRSSFVPMWFFWTSGFRS